jgi:hypothetical protein
MKFKVIAICFVLLCLTSVAVAAESYQEDGITEIDYECPDDYYILSVKLNNIEPNFNTTTVLDAYGQEYVLYVNNTREWPYWTFDVSLVYPNGTVEYYRIKSDFKPLAGNADINIQTYLSSQAASLLGLDVDVYIGLLPLSATFSEISLFGEVVAFSDVQCSCNNEFDFEATYVDWEEYAEIEETAIKNFFSSTDEIFSWVFSSILSFVEMIPGVGPYLATALEMSAAIIGEVFFYLDLLFIEYPETTLMTIEFFILGATLLKTKKNGNMWDMFEIYISLHRSVIEFFYNFAVRTIEMLVDLIKMVASIVSSIKPL